MTSSTVSSESAPRSSTNEDSILMSASATPSCSATIFFTRCSISDMLWLHYVCYGKRAFYQVCALKNEFRHVLQNKPKSLLKDVNMRPTAACAHQFIYIPPFTWRVVPVI